MQADLLIDQEKETKNKTKSARWFRNGFKS